MSFLSSINDSTPFVNNQAISFADEDKTNSAPHANSSLAPLRLAVKDLFHIRGIPTAAGNPTWLATHPVPQSTNSSVTALLQSGAHYVGKTVTDELAYSLNGLNIHYPTLHNPVTPNRLVGGSSSGSAAAVSADLADIGLGTDTGGSIRVPASYNGLFGLRTTHGAISCDNMVPLAPSFDTVGWMCQNIDNLYKVAQVLLPARQNTAIHKPRIYVASNLVNNSEQAAAITDWVQTLTNSSITSAPFAADSLQSSATFRTLQGYEIWQQHGQWITECQPTFADDVQQRFSWCKEISYEQQQKASQQQQLIIQHINMIFAHHDLMLLPTTPGRSPLLGQPANTMATYREDLMSLTAIAGLTGRPQIHLPLFTIEGAPCGLSLIGNKNSDLLLITMARELIKQSETSTKAKHTL